MEIRCKMIEQLTWYMASNREARSCLERFRPINTKLPFFNYHSTDPKEVSIRLLWACGPQAENCFISVKKKHSHFRIDVEKAQ